MRRLPLRSRGYGCFLTLTLCMALAASPAHAQNTAPHSTTGHHAKARTQPARNAAAKPAAPAGEQFADGIAAVVGKDVITMSDLNAAVQQASTSLKQQRIQAPPMDVMQRQVLNRLIMDRVMAQEAKRQGILLTDAQVDQAIAMIASRNHIAVAQMKAEIIKSGTSWDEYRKAIHDELLSDRLRQRVVDAKIFISDSEIDAFLKEYARSEAAAPKPAPAAAAPVPAQARVQPQVKIVPNGAVELSEILVHVPEGASPETVARARQKADSLLARIRKGADFASLAAANSDGPDALHGGKLGVRPLEGWPDLFVNAIRNLMPGQVTGVLRAGNGFHIVKVTARAMERVAVPVQQQQAPAPNVQQLEAIPSAAAGTVEITQTHARHILIKVSAVMTDAEARQKLEEIRQRIVSGQAKFEDMARQYSQDSTASQGGDLGWLSPGQTVPAFEQAMDKLKPGEISEPVVSPFGWHLIEVIARRQHDATDEVRRNRARQILMERQAGPAFEDYMDQVQAQTFIDNRLVKAEELKQRYQQ
mgnify:FL=1